MSNRKSRGATCRKSLTAADAAVAKGMLARGDRQHDIAAWFGVNGGRIGEIATGQKFQYVSAVHENLPPPGPYTSGRSAESAKAAIAEAAADLSAIVQKLEARLAAY